MIRKANDYQWENVDVLCYKEDGSPFRNVTRQILFDGEGNIPCQWRYFEVGEGGWSTLEHHAHTHWVMVIRGCGTCLVGEAVTAIETGDLVTIMPWQWHQFRADRGEPLGFLCLVNQERDKVTLPTSDDLAEMKKSPVIKRFLEGNSDESKKNQPMS